MNKTASKAQGGGCSYLPQTPKGAFWESSLKLKCDNLTSNNISIVLLLRRTLVLHQVYSTLTQCRTIN